MKNLFLEKLRGSREGNTEKKFFETVKNFLYACFKATKNFLIFFLDRAYNSMYNYERIILFPLSNKKI